MALDLGPTRTATDEQGNLIETAFDVSGASPALTVLRDTTFQPIFVNDTLYLPDHENGLTAYRLPH